jgi:hypothetical protein
MAYLTRTANGKYTYEDTSTYVTHLVATNTIRCGPPLRNMRAAPIGLANLKTCRDGYVDVQVCGGPLPDYDTLVWRWE